MEPEHSQIDNTILAAQCVKCKTITYPVRLICPECRSTNHEPINIPIEGKIFSYTIINIPLVNYNNTQNILAFIYFENNTRLRVTARLELPKGKETAIGQKVKLFTQTFPESKMIPILVAKIL